MSLEKNKSIIYLIFEQALNQGNFALIDKLFSPSFIDHSTPDQLPGPQGVKQYFSLVHAGFPDITVTIDDIIAEGEKVVVRSTWCGTHQGSYEGIAPTSRQVTRIMIQIFRIEDGKVMEEWNEGGNLLS